MGNRYITGCSASLLIRKIQVKIIMNYCLTPVRMATIKTREKRFSLSVVSDSLWPHGLQHARILCLSPTPRVYSNSCPLSSDAIKPSHPLSSASPPAFNLSQHQGLFQGVSSSHQVAKYWSFSFSISPSNEHSGLISFRMDWLDLRVVRGHSRGFSNTTVQKHQFFSAQLSL